MHDPKQSQAETLYALRAHLASGSGFDRGSGLLDSLHEVSSEARDLVAEALRWNGGHVLRGHGYRAGNSG